MQGIPRAACRPALNDEVGVRLRGIFSRLFYNVITSLPWGIPRAACRRALNDEVRRKVLITFI